MIEAWSDEMGDRCDCRGGALCGRVAADVRSKIQSPGGRPLTDQDSSADAELRVGYSRHSTQRPATISAAP